MLTRARVWMYFMVALPFGDPKVRVTAARHGQGIQGRHHPVWRRNQGKAPPGQHSPGHRAEARMSFYFKGGGNQGARVLPAPWPWSGSSERAVIWP